MRIRSLLLNLSGILLGLTASAAFVSEVFGAKDDKMYCEIFDDSLADDENFENLFNTYINFCSGPIESGRYRGATLANLYNQRGRMWLSKGELDRALSDFDEAIKLDRTETAQFANRALVFARKGDLDRAVADNNESLRLNPKNAATYNSRGLNWRDKGDYDRAIADFNEAIRFSPKYAKAFANRGEIWRLKGDLDRALADQDRAIAIAPNLSIILVLRADTLRYKGALSRALSNYDDVIRKRPDFPVAYVGRGLTHEKMGDQARARTDFEKALTFPDAKDDTATSAQQTARARLAALDSGAPLPTIPAAPSKAGSATSIPTPATSVAVAPTSSAATAAKAGRRVALIIGNSAYKNVAPLLNPQRDADAIVASLRNIGFETVVLAPDMTRETLVNALRSFANEAEKADWAVVYYAGHGIEVNGVNYLIPIDAKLAADRDVQFEAIPLDQVMVAVESARKLKLIILDACRDNPFAPGMRKTEAPAPVAAVSTAGGAVGTRSVGRGLAEVKVSSGSLVVYAAKHGQVALDGDGANSPFAVALVQRLATPGVEINKIFRLVRDDVMEATAGRQEPYTYGSLPGREDFFFVAGK